MRARPVIPFAALPTLALVLAITLGGALAADPPPSAPAAQRHTVVAFYFHGTQRCKTCLHIESTAERVLRERFDGELKAGDLAWQSIDYDNPENEHFIKDFQLVASSVVLVELDGKTTVRHKVLDKTWQYARNDAELEAYVGGETAAFLKAVRG